MVIDMNRNEDLTKVFDRTWKANHNNDVKEARAKEKKFWDKMFNVKESNTSSRGVITPGEQVGNLQRNMNNAAFSTLIVSLPLTLRSLNRSRLQL